MIGNRIVSVLTVISLLLCVLAGYSLSSQARSYQNEYDTLQSEIIERGKEREVIVRNDSVESEEERIEKIISVTGRASDAAAKVVDAEETMNEIMAQLDSSSIDDNIDTKALYDRLFEAYDVIDGVFDVREMTSVPWLSLDVLNDTSKDFHWKYTVSSDVNGTTVPVLFTMENSMGDILAYVLAMYEASSDSMSYLKKHCMYGAFKLLPKNVEENGLVDDSDEAFVDTVVALMDKLSYSDDLIEGDPEQEPDPDDPDWNAVIEYRDSMVASDYDYDDFYDGEPEWGDD